ncbi:TolC family protein [bacterium]|nr:TolC family protein [bacterium]
MKKLMTALLLVVCGFALSLPRPAEADTLMSLYQSAIRYFPSLRSYEYKEQSLKSERTGLGWQRVLDVDVEANYYNLDTRNFGAYPNNDMSIFDTIDIFNKKGLDRGITGYEIQKNKSLSDVEKKRIFSDVAEAYFALLMNTRLLAVHEESLEWIDKNILLVDTGVENGVFPASEINRWTIEKLSRQNSLLSDKMEIARLKETLRMLTGLTDITVEEDVLTGNTQVTVDDLLAHTPELAVYDLEKKQVELDIRKENWSRFPDLQVGGSLIQNNEPESTGDQKVVSANLRFKLLDGGRGFRIASSRARMKSIESEAETARSQYMSLYLNTIREMNAQREMLENLRVARDLSADNLEKLTAGYKKRFVDFIALFDAFREDITIREDYITTFSRYHQTNQYLSHLSQGDIYF